VRRSADNASADRASKEHVHASEIDMRMKRLSLTAAVAAALAASAAMAATTQLEIYKAPNFQGPADTIKGEVANLEHGFGNEVSSIVARGGAWQVCTGDHFTGRCKVIREGRYPTLGWLDDRITSVKFLGNERDLARYDTWDRRHMDRTDAQDSRQDRRASREGNEWRDRQRPSSDADAASGYNEYNRRSDTSDRRWGDRTQ
jgi:hypothetical protein